MSEYLITQDGRTIGFGNGADYTPLEYLQRSDPKKDIMPKGFRKLMLHYPLACAEWKKGGKVFGFRIQDIIEQDFSHRKR